MNKTKNIHNNNQINNQNKKLFVASIAIAALALTLFVSPMLNVDDALATHNKKNKAKQSIDQSQSSNQNAGCVSGVTTFLSCNNLSFQHQKNTGNNALAQQAGQGGNSADQSISQSQSSSQNSQVVSGGDTIGSGNNINVQSQENTGSNALAQG
jgi:succinate dehydrogenase/fumarate reductase-like Fe-S protein